jgi:hypothetical protein
LWGEARLGEISFAAGLRGLGPRPSLPSISLRQPFIRNSHQLGQTKCYRCGNQGVRPMLPGMAAMVPGGCVEVDGSQCAAPTQPGPFQPGTGGTPGGLAMDSPAWQGPTEINLTVLEPMELGPFHAGARVTVDLLDWAASTDPANAVIAQRAAAVGETDSEGKWFWTGTAPAPNRNYKWRITVEPGPKSPSFPKKVVDIPARTPVAAAQANGAPERFNPTVAVCLSGTEQIVCEVADAQVSFIASMAQCEVAHGSSPQAKGFCADQSQSFTQFGPTIMAHFDVYKWWVQDLSISPKDWPRLNRNYEQLLEVFQAIPFPKVPGAEDLWVRCARRVPLWKGSSVADPKLYVSDYFPRSGYQIEVDMAFQYLTNIPATIVCMVERIEAKARDLAKKANTFKILGIVALVMLAPLSGGASVSLLATEGAELGYTLAAGKPPPGTVSTLVTGGVALASADPAALEKLITAGISLLMKNYGEGLNPIVQKIISAAVPKLVSTAMGDVLSGATTATAGAGSGAADFISLASIGSAVAAMAVKLVSNMITSLGVRGVKEFKKTVLGMQDLPTLMIPFTLWAMNVLFLDKLFEEAARQAGLEQDAAAGGVAPAPPPGDVPIGDFNAGQDVVDPLLHDAASQGVEVPPSAIAQRPPVLDAAAAGPSTVGSVAGIGGAALALLLVTGAISV